MISTSRSTSKAILLAAATPLAFILSTATGFAQDATTTTDASATAPAPATIAPQDTKAEPADATGQEIVVTGSLFRRTDTETPSPVTVLTTQTLQRAGITNINDAVRSISADGAGSISTGFQNGFSAGGAAVSLRGLGVSSTLVLIDGLRSTNFPLNDDGHNAYVDLNSIPFSAVERIEVLKDGASSSYGADAIGGVVNIIMKKHVVGVSGTAEGGISELGDGGRYRANLTAGIGDYDRQGFNFYVNGEYQKDTAISVSDRKFPFNTLDLSSIGGIDGNPNDNALPQSTINALVVRTSQTDLNNPYAGGRTAAANGTYVNAAGQTVPYSNFTSLNLNCGNGSYTVTTGGSRGTACKHDNTTEYVQIQPAQERYAFSSRLSLKISDNIEGYVSGSYSHNQVVTKTRPPSAIRQTQPYGASPALASNNPGVVLPVYVCSAGINCVTAADRQLNPNNPYATAFANDPSNGAARIYYLFGDLPASQIRTNEVIRGAAGLRGTFEGGWNWQVDAVGAKDNLNIDSLGVINIAGLKQAINTGAYNFVNPSANSQATRDLVAPRFSVGSHTSLASLDASISKQLFDLPGGPLQVAVGGQIRHEVEENNSLNANLDRYANTSAAFGSHTVSAGYFEINAPVLSTLEINGSGRYDHYSEGFSNFSPKIGAKFTPIKQIAVRGTYSKGFRAPTFAENNARSSYAGFVTVTPPCSFILAHGGTGTLTSCQANGNPYNLAYSLGSGFTGNPDLKPEKSRSFTGGVVIEPTPWFSFTVDYYNIKKTNVIVTGPQSSDARAAYFAGTPLPAGYTVSAVDAIDPLFPAALPRVLIINAPYVNAASQSVSGIDLGANVNVPLGGEARFISRIDVTRLFKYNVDNGDGVVQKYAGTLGPYELSSGAGTPRIRGNWQNTLQFGAFSLTATTYYVSRIKAVAADEVAPDDAGNIDLSCANNLYGTGDKFCYIKRFIYADLNMSVEVNDKFSFNFNVGNFTNEKAPVAPASYSGTNYLPTWHYAGVIGRTFRAGANFKF
ncbi:iron complex outermembrane receptor protein [Sphingomonas sp. PP-F2F-G114-C0414]|uniref:TonB-dependent receptor domain-containing protein n=1 Tax=Sphingomonas sp. PP-F2F-G114-C0414 TaxID=2135662 RepID=UPI000EF86F60|nr:TonB-dependent receptor [Sphingomonas sp. PP-F2F-G114-C0414]RMB35766.1 iron complex outermembrane receptor protein [Sphingomonas sp. PP-F2F-G114-C0414]